MKLFIILMFVLLTGCDAMRTVSDRAAQKVGDSVQWYCGNVDEADRVEFRELANRYTDPHHVAVTCRGDSESTIF